MRLSKLGILNWMHTYLNIYAKKNRSEYVCVYSIVYNKTNDNNNKTKLQFSWWNFFFISNTFKNVTRATENEIFSIYLQNKIILHILNLIMWKSVKFGSQFLFTYLYLTLKLCAKQILAMPMFGLSTRPVLLSHYLCWRNAISFSSNSAHKRYE